MKYTENMVFMVTDESQELHPRAEPSFSQSPI
jgi:hypothetical protein